MPRTSGRLPSGGDKPMGLFVLREKGDGVYYIEREIEGFDGMVWAIAEVRGEYLACWW